MIGSEGKEESPKLSNNKPPVNMYDINQKWTEMKRLRLNREITFTDNCDFITEDPREKTKSREEIDQ